MSLSNVDYVGYKSKWFHIRNAIPKSRAFPRGVTNGCRVVTRVTLGVANQPRNVQVHIQATTQQTIELWFSP